jgi:hypothetical protein
LGPDDSDRRKCAHADTFTDPDTLSYRRGDTNASANTGTNAYVYTYAYTYTYSNANGDASASANACSWFGSCLQF